jgi:hypothetical protein
MGVGGAQRTVPVEGSPEKGRRNGQHRRRRRSPDLASNSNSDTPLDSSTLLFPRKLTFGQDDMFFFFFHFLPFLEIRSNYAAQAGLKLTVLLP